MIFYSLRFIGTRLVRSARCSRNLIYLASCLALCWAPAIGKDPPPYSISGRVLELGGRPAIGVPVLLREMDGDLSIKGRTNDSGEFELGHENASALTLVVQPSLKSGYACALIENLPGRESRKLIVRLRQGFTVSGRVEHGGKGVKGVVVTVSAVGPGSDKASGANSSLKQDKSHGGGAAVTAKDGTFAFNLTAGAKKLVIRDCKSAALAGPLEKEFVVEEAMDLGDISL